MIGRQMALEERFDWQRTQYADPRSPGRFGAHARGAINCSDEAAHQAAMVTLCGWFARCASPGPLIQDVEEKLQKTPENELYPEQLTTQALGLDAAEESALRKLEKIKSEKLNLQHRNGKGKGKSGGDSTPSTTASIVAKKTPKGTCHGLRAAANRRSGSHRREGVARGALVSHDLPKGITDDALCLHEADASVSYMTKSFNVRAKRPHHCGSKGGS